MSGKNGQSMPGDGVMSAVDPFSSDALVVRTLNHLFYDVEAEQYDERHPEVIEGDAGWWSSRGERIVRELKSGSAAGRGVRILDVGCGTGFVSSLLCAQLGAVVGAELSHATLGLLDGRARALDAMLLCPQILLCFQALAASLAQHKLAGKAICGEAFESLFLLHKNR